jgi:Flp pilus assembly protein TadD
MCTSIETLIEIYRFLEAEKDCTRGLQLQPKNVKALWRRGIALRELGRINEARKGKNALGKGLPVS